MSADLDLQTVVIYFLSASGSQSNPVTLREEVHKIAWFESVVTNTKEAVVITAINFDTSGSRIIYVNQAFTAMTGYSLSEVLGKSPRYLQGPNTDQSQIDQLSECIAKWEPCEITIVNYKKTVKNFGLTFLFLLYPMIRGTIPIGLLFKGR